MKKIVSFAIALIAFTTAQADLVVDSLGVVNMENAVIDTANVEKLYTDSLVFTNGINIKGNILSAARSTLVFERSVYIEDITNHNSHSYTDIANQYAFSIGSTRPTAYFYNYNNNNATAAITSETFDANGLLFQGTYKSANAITAQVRADGTYFARGGYVTASDGNLKENIQSVSNSLDAIQEINPVSYTLKSISTSSTEDNERTMQRATAETEVADSEADAVWEDEMNRPKYGFIAEEIEEIFPNVVYTMPSGDKGIAYQELIPILVSAIQEQQAEIEALTTQIEELKTPATQQRQQAPAAMQDAITDGSATLMQNTPNPFNQATEIGYRLPEGSATALIMVCDMNGKMLQTYPLAVNSTNGTLTIQAGSYAPGMYLYTLIIDGVQIDTKQMIILAH